MSAHLWKAYFEDDLERFRQLLANASYLAATPVRGGQGGKAGSTSASGSPAVGLATSPNITNKSKKSHGWASSASSSWNGPSRPVTGITLTRGDINWRDANGVTLLHQIASSANEKASQYAFALLRVPMIDLFIQDNESGWTALHRALYFGNVTIARALISRDIQDTIADSNLGAAHVTCGSIKIKDREGNSPFDVYGSSITTRVIRPISSIPLLSGPEDDEDDDMVCGAIADHEGNENDREVTPRINIGGDEIFTFGSNKNFTLGFGDEDDRQYPERISLKRPDHLLHRFQNEHQAQKSEAHVLKSAFGTSDPLPALIKHRPIVIQDVQLSKLHSAILTTDPEANLYICGFGPGGRLGTGDETTRFHFVCICGGGLANKRVVHVALGQNHTVAISSHGEVFTWGSNAFGQLGYSPPSSNLNDEEPLQLLPRQVFGSVKRETVIGAAASRCHTVLHTANSLFTFGKNDGQLGLVDSDARSLVMQTTPRKVAASLFSSPVSLVSAIEKATICLLENHDVWIFANYGYTKMSFPLETFSSSRLKGSYSATKFSNTKNYICKITSGGDTICAMSAEGDVFTINVSQKLQSDTTTASTTNPSKIRGALSSPQKVWSLRKDHMAVRDVAVGQDGSIMICTDSGSVWRRVKRAMIKDTDASRTAEYKPKDYKFSRVGGLTRVTAVRSSTFGAYAAVRKDCDVLKTQIEVDHHQIWKDLYPLLPFRELGLDEDSDTELPAPRFWTPSPSHNIKATIRRAILCSNNLEGQLMAVLKDQETPRRFTYDLRVTTTTSDVIIPVHEFILSGRSEVMRRSFTAFRQSYFLNIPEIMTIEYDKDGKILISFLAVDFVTLLNFVMYIYTDYFVDIWYNVKSAPESAVRFRQIRLELMKIASYLDLPRLEQAARVMNEPSKTLHKDMERAIQQPEYFDFGDVEIMLDGTSMKVHSDLICQRCPFFDGLFNGRADGLWLSSRREQVQEPQEAIRVDLKHVDAKVFRYVLRYLYADSGEEIFDDIVTADFDAFLDLILDIMSVANELMLDRLQQCCQKMLGRFVNVRNVCQLLNAVAPCSVTEFKDASLEYICLNLEGMLENHLLDELDGDLMLELDQVVRQNQLVCLPYAKSGKAEAELFEAYPELPGIIETNKRAKIASMAQRSQYHEESRPGDSSKSRATSTDNSVGAPQSRAQSGSSMEKGILFKSPSLKSQSSNTDLMFEMDEGETMGTPVSDEMTTSELDHPLPSSSLTFHKQHDAVAVSMSPSLFDDQIQHRNPESSSQQGTTASSSSAKAWGLSALNPSKLDMKDIMAQASLNRVSNISSGLSIQAHSSGPSVGSPARLSQRERRKKQQQQQMQETLSEPLPASVGLDTNSHQPSSPWQVTPRGQKFSLEDVVRAEDKSSSPRNPIRTSSNPPLTMRQTVAGNSTTAKRTGSSSKSPQSLSAARSNTAPPLSHPSKPASSVVPIRSVTHQPRPVEPSLQLSMADILSQQQSEKDIIRDAAAKRSLQEIQEEQAFQEWWDQESRKVMMEEEQEQEQAAAAAQAGRGRGRGRGKGRGRRRERGR